MKKRILAVGMSLALLLGGCSSGSVKMGQSIGAPHGTRSFAVTTVTMNGDKITSALIDEYQFMAADSVTGVPNSDSDFGANFVEGQVLVSKRENNVAYSANMSERGGATQDLVTSWEAIEKYVVGKTVKDLEGVDTVSGSTLTDTQGYLEEIIAAANNAK